MSSAPADARRRLERAGLAALLLVLWFVQWPVLLGPGFVNRDSAAYVAAAEVLRAGGRPYLDYWDHKPPLVHVIDALALSLGGGHLWAIWIIGAAALLGALLLADVAMRRALGDGSALVGGAVFLATLSIALEGGNHVEHYALPLQFGTVLLLLRWIRGELRSSAFGAVLGTLGALAFFLRANLIGAMVCAVLAAFVELTRRRDARGALALSAGFAAGFLVVAAATAGYLLAHGALGAFWDQVIRYNGLYASVGWSERYRAAVWVVQTAGSYALPLAMAGWLLAVSRLRSSDAEPTRTLSVLIALWMPVEILLASLSARLYPHYLMAVAPAMAWGAALLVSAVDWRSPRDQAPPRWSATVGRLLAAGILVVLLAQTLLGVRGALLYGFPRGRALQVADAARVVQARSVAGDPVFVWGAEPDLYVLSDRQPATRYIYVYPLLTRGYADEGLIQSFLEELRRAAPTVIVDASVDPVSLERIMPPMLPWDASWSRGAYASGDGLEALQRLIEESYVATDTIGRARWVVYARREPPGRESPVGR